MPNDVMIQCENLTKRFGDFTVVDHVSFSVEKRSIFGFLGPNGSGKTTVIRMLCGILEPSDGREQIARVNLATMLSGPGRLPGAVVHLDEGLRCKPDDAMTRANLQLARQALAKLQEHGAAGQR